MKQFTLQEHCVSGFRLIVTLWKKLKGSNTLADWFRQLISPQDYFPFTTFRGVKIISLAVNRDFSLFLLFATSPCLQTLFCSCSSMSSGPEFLRPVTLELTGFICVTPNW
jgi:hypothetical protein